jgi:hypothetical protein
MRLYLVSCSPAVRISGGQANSAYEPRVDISRLIVAVTTTQHRHVEVNACAQDFVAVLVFGLNLFEDQRRRVGHSKIKIPTASKDTPLPIAFQGMGDSWRETNSALVATQETSKKAAAVTASITSD